MKEKSWLKLYRRMESWEWFTDSKTVHVFIYLLIRASIKNSRWNGKTVKRGQVVTSYQHIAAATGMSVSSARRAIDNLVSTGEIICQPTNRYNLITISKYDAYQEKYAESSDFEQSTEQSTEQADEHATEQSTEHHYKNGKEEKKNKEKDRRKNVKPKENIKAPNLDDKSKKEDYIPRYFELDLKLPKRYYGRFQTEAEWWDYVEEHREEVEQAYEL